MVVKPIYVYLAVGLAGALIALLAVTMLGHGSTAATRTVILAVDPPAQAPAPSDAELNLRAAEANVRGALPGIEAYNIDHGTYSGASEETLSASYDASIKDIQVTQASLSDYCIESTVNGQTASKNGPNALNIVAGACPAS